MKSSASIENLAKALIKAQSEFPDIPRTKEVIVQGKNGSYTFKYAPLEKTLPVIKPVLQQNGLGYTQGGDGENLVTTIFHTSGEWISHSMPLIDPGNPQQYGSHFSYKRRYALEGALGIKTDDGDDDRGFKDDGKPKRITPNAGALDGVPKERHNFIHTRSSTIIDYWNAGNQDEAYKAWREVSVNEEKLAVWANLDSKMRRELKRRDAEAARG